MTGNDVELVNVGGVDGVAYADFSRVASDAARLIAVVVLPTPPF